jgi:acyl dehydratase
VPYQAEEAYLEPGRITDEALAEFKSRVGKKLRSRHEGNELASRETITSFARGVGDVNPLFNDEEYAGKTRYGCLVAPPAWLYSTSGPGVMQGLRGVQGFHAGDEWEYYQPVLIGDRIRFDIIFSGLEEKTSEFAGRMLVEYQDIIYYNQRDEMVAKNRLWIMRVERQASRKKGKYSRLQLPHPWTEDEIERIENEVMAEEIRGGKVRYWEDVKVGEKLPPVVKGPLGVSDEMAFLSGLRGAYIKAHRARLDGYKRHPAAYFRDPNTHSLEPIQAIHYNIPASVAAGLPYPYAIGMQMNSWMVNLLTNWMGDEGWLKTCYDEFRHFVYLSDVVWLRGEVTRKYVDDNHEYCVDIETTGFNQRAENTIPGRATVILPSKGAQTWPVKKRLPG